MSTPVSILLVEDNAADARLVREMLGEAWGSGAAVRHVSRLAEAVAALAKGGAEVVLLDLSLPDARGLDTVRRMQTMAPAIPIVVLTGLEDGRLAHDALRQGAQDYVPKGRLDADVLVRTIRYAIDRKRHEQELRKSERRFRELADAMPQLVWTAEPDGAVDYYNERWREFAGFERTGDGWRWEPVLHPDDAGPTVDAWRRSVRTGEVYQIEHRVKLAGGQYRWFLSRAVPSRDESGRVVKWFGTATDIHDQRVAAEELRQHRERLEDLVRRRTAELEQSNQHLRLAERLASIGTLSAGIGHDMANLLLPIRTRLEAMRDRGLPPELTGDVDAIEKAATYLQSLATGLRLLAEDPETGAANGSTDLHSWWPEAAALLRNVLPRGTVLEVRLTPDLPSVRVAKAGLTQAVFNLVQNAGDALRDVPGARVQVWAEPAHDRRAVRIGITDNGPGMSEDVQRRCLEPFFTTKARGISTGLGLSLVRGIVRGAGGSITVESQPGRGSTFILTFAAAGDATRGGAPAARAVVTLGDPRQRGFVAATLDALGLAVSTDREPDRSTRLWITEADAVAPGEIAAFLAAHPARRAVVIGGGPESRGELPQSQAIVVEGPFSAAAVRSALRIAAGADHAGPPGTAAGPTCA